MERKKYPVAILGATGLVGQKAIALLENHTQFYVEELVASERNVGLLYEDVVDWREPISIPDSIAKKEIVGVESIRSQFVLSALPTEEARLIEELLARKGHWISSNASTNRMRADVPLLMPGVNSESLTLCDEQEWDGVLVTNPNCCVTLVAPALGAIRHLGNIQFVSAVTLQAVSGAGIAGVKGLDILGNLLPYIAGEEEKIERETHKILNVNFPITAHSHRVPVLNGHTITVHVMFDRAVAVRDAQRCFEGREMFDFHEKWITPRDLSPYDLSVHVHRLKQGGSSNVIGFEVMGHNLVQGAAGAAILNLEALLSYVPTRGRVAR